MIEPSMRSQVFLFAITLFLTSECFAEKRAKDFLKQPDAWFSSSECLTIAENIFSYQSNEGGWPKNTDTVNNAFQGDRKSLHPTFDNGATTDELRFLARTYEATRSEKVRKAFDKGLAYILVAQYPNGGWPQTFPLSNGYNRHITYNDNSMVRIMEFLREVSLQPRYVFVAAKQRDACRTAFENGIACILKCQIVVDGKPTVWCAQHHAETLLPVSARAYELPSFSGSESVGLTRLLMSLDEPMPEVKGAIEGAVRWFELAKLTGIRIEAVDAPTTPKGKDRIVVVDANAPACWARFYDLTNGKPMFCDRDGIPKSTIAQIGYERRNGYAWYGTWPNDLIERDYPAWCKRVK